jgi:hypothetical protein
MLTVTVSSCNKLKKDLVELGQDAVESRVGTAAIKNLHQLAPSMLAVTLCDDRYGANKRCTATSAPLLNELNVLRPWMSGSGQVESFNPALQLAVMGFAGNVCALFVQAESTLGASARKVFNSVSFDQAPAALSISARQDVTQRVYLNFFGRAPSGEESQVFMSYFLEATPTLGSSTSDTRLLLTGACAVALGSLEFMSS